MKENKIKFSVNYAGEVEMTMAIPADSKSGSLYDISESFRKMLYKTLCEMKVDDLLVIDAKLIPHAASGWQ